jgi:hypothetical protein
MLALLLCGIYGRTAAATPSFTVSPQTGQGQIEFATLQQPSSGSQTCIMPPSTGCPCPGGYCAGASTGTPLYGSADNGAWTIKCTGCSGNSTISITNVSPNCAGVSSISSWSAYYNGSALSGGGPWTASIDTTAKSFWLGATATYSSSVSTPSSCTGTFDISLTNGATNQQFSEQVLIGFDLGLSMTKTSDINFGTVTAANATTYQISTAGAVSVVSGTGQTIYGSTSAANITISGSTSDTITISTGSYNANNGVTPSNATCSYNGGAASYCDAGISVAAPGAGTTLLLGVNAAADGTQAAGTAAAPTFVVSVTYN